MASMIPAAGGGLAAGADAPPELAGRSQRAAKNVLVSVGTQLILWALAFYVGLYLPRYLGRDRFGQFELAGAFVMLLNVVIPLGTSQVLIKQIARDPDQTLPLIRAALLLRVGLGLILGGSTVGIVWLLGYGHFLSLLVAIMAAGTLVGVLGDVLVSALQGQEKMARQSVVALVEKFLFSGLTLFFITLKAGLPALASVSIFTGLVSLFFNVFAFRGLLPRSVRKNAAARPLWPEMQSLARAGLPFLGWLVFRTLYGQTDRLVLGLVGTLADVAWYGVAFRLAGSAMFFPSAISSALLPALSALYTQNQTDFARMARRMLSLVLFLGVPCSLVFCAIPARLLALTRLPFDQFGGTIPVLQIGGIATLLWFIAIALGTVVVASDGQAKMFRASVWAAIVGVPACVLFSLGTKHRFGNGAIGAITSDVVVEMLLICFYLRATPVGVWNRQTVWEAGRFVLAAVPLALLLFVPFFARWGWFDVVLGGGVYVGASVLLGAVPLSEVRKLLKR